MDRRKAAAFIDHSYMSIAANRSGLNYSIGRVITKAAGDALVVDRRLYGSTVAVEHRAGLPADANLKLERRRKFFDDKRQEGYKVVVVDRARRDGEKFHCKECGNRFTIESVSCTRCARRVAIPRQKAFFEEKEVDVAIATDMISLAKDGVFDQILLFSGDRDFKYVVERLHYIGKPVINASFRWGHSHSLARRCRELGGDYVLLDDWVGSRDVAPVWRKPQ